MTIQLHAQPYDASARGFYFESYEAYQAKAAKAVNAYGQKAEEFDIQFIDGERIDSELARAIGINQGNLKRYFDCVEAWDDHDKTLVIIAVGACGYSFEDDTRPDDFDLDFYACDSLRELAEQFVVDGLFGDIPERLQCYIDYEALGRDLAVDYTQTDVAGQRLIYRCA